MAIERITGSFARSLAIQRQQGLLWVPVLLGLGISFYFRMGTEPSVVSFWLAGLFVAICAVLALVMSEKFAIIPIILGMIALGFVLAVLRANSVAEPVLGWRYYGPVEGTVVGLDRSSSDRPRVTLADPTMGKISLPRTPTKIRVSLYGEGEVPKPGQRVAVVASFSPPTGPSEPRGYDFQRRAWFHSLGAVGYSRKPMTVIAEPDLSNWRLRIFDIRMRLSSGLRQYLPAKEGGFASAILTGDRAYIDQNSLQHLRRANLAHLLAISGLHMGLMTGVVFLFVRAGLALVPSIALRIPTKKIAAVVALIAGFSYLMLSGAAVATERAFIMVAVMLGAILLDRPAISLRAVAIAAIIILSIWPENLLEPGFQMSFAATAALVICFGALKEVAWWQAMNRGRWRIIQPLIGLTGSSLIAGAATAPFAAYHFNQMSHYGVIANLASLPMMGMIIMPAAVIAALLIPFGLQAWPLWVMGKGISWILIVAEWVSGLGGAVSLIPQSAPNTLILLVMGTILFVLLHHWQKTLGACLILAGLVTWQFADRPHVLVTGNGRLVGILDAEMRSLNRKRGNGFSAKTWIENDGLVFDQIINAAAFDKNDDRFSVPVGNGEMFYLWEKETPKAEMDTLCDKYQVVIAPKWEEYFSGPCEFWGKKRLAYDGSLSFDEGKAGIKIETARQITGERLWNSYQLRKKRDLNYRD